MSPRKKKSEAIEGELVSNAHAIAQLEAGTITQEDRRQLIQRMSEEFLAKKFQNSNLAETVRERALQRLLDQMEDMNPSKLMQLLNQLQEHSVQDSNIIAGTSGEGAGGGGGMNIFIGGGGNGGSNANASPFTVKQTKFLEDLLSAADAAANSN